MNNVSRETSYCWVIGNTDRKELMKKEIFVEEVTGTLVTAECYFIDSNTYEEVSILIDGVYPCQNNYLDMVKSIFDTPRKQFIRILKERIMSRLVRLEKE